MITGTHFLVLGTGMCNGLAFWIVAVSLLCLLWVMCGCNSHFVGIGMWDGLEMCLTWS